MPEGPQCRRTASYLESEVGGKVLTDVRITSGRYRTHGVFEGYSFLTDALPLRLCYVGGRGKLIIFMFERGIYLLSTLGLTGKWTSRKGKHSGLCFTFKDQVMYYDDQMHFGTVRVVAFAAMVKAVLGLGHDVCGEEPLLITYMNDCIERRSSWEICKLLMDQKSFAGIGNYIKAEVLYAAKIAPMSICGSIPSEALHLLVDAINRICVLHYTQLISGARRERLKVYGKKKDSIGNIVKREKTGDGRTSHWVPCLQVVYC